MTTKEMFLAWMRASVNSNEEKWKEIFYMFNQKDKVNYFVNVK